ncbi:MAG: TrkH family potassium uptake protein, partial [Anaerotignum sp.]|nr:TrkH family potassium uptake protein [Anaerotignum sp.]
AMVGPVENFSFFSGFSKLVLCFDMLLGRLEIFPIVMLFAPSIWRKSYM